MIKFFNTFTRKKEEFVPLEDKTVKLYTCGPTVYDLAHIGNFRAYMFEDLLHRYLEYRGYKVVRVMNITDVDDKTIAGSEKEGISLKEYTERYTKSFIEDMETLRVKKPDYLPRATETIPEMVVLVKKLLEKGYAYRKENSVYFRLSKFPEYGKLSHIDLSGIKPGARVETDEYTKEDVRDFALWKDSKKGEISWDTDIGKGRPGWHIECSAMSMKYLGETFDIHTGGVDNLFPHHENEIAQSEAATGKQFVKYWMHCAHLLVNNEKMSKSKGNFYTIRDLLKKGYNSAGIRYLLLTTHYKAMLNFTEKSLAQAENTVRNYNDFYQKLNFYKGTAFNQKLSDKQMKCSGAIHRLSDKQMECSGAIHRTKFAFNQKLSDGVKIAKEQFISHLDDDLNISPAMAGVFNLIKESNICLNNGSFNEKNISEVKTFLEEIDTVLAILESGEKKKKLSGEIEKLIEEREQARKEKNFKRADEIRDYLKEQGIVLEDTPDGTIWKKE